MKWLLLVAGILLGCIVSIELNERTLLQQVRAGDVVLRCDMQGGTRDIDPALVVRHHEGGWVFTNGFSSQCMLVAP